MKHILFIFLTGITRGVPASTVMSSPARLTYVEHRVMGSHFIPGLNRAAFYTAMASEDKDLVDAQIAALNSAPSDTINAFLGAMTMKKAGIGGSLTDKLRLFKKGHKLLEEAIRQDPNNVEFRFLRLIIQENAPGILGYKTDEETDSEFIRKAYKSLPEDLQKAIADYGKSSQILKLKAV